MNFEILLAREYPHFAPQGDRLLVQDELFDHHGRRLRTQRRRLGVDHSHPCLSGEPEPAIPCLHSRGLAAAVALGVEHAVALAVGYRDDGPSSPRGEIIQLSFADPVDTLVATHPEVSAVVFQDLKNSVVEEAFPYGIRGNPPVLEPVQTAVISADPERAVAVFVDRPDVITRQAVLLRIGGEPTVAQATETAQRTEPEVADAVLVDGLYLTVDKTVGGRVGAEHAVLISVQAARRAEPKVAGAVLVYGQNSVIREAVTLAKSGEAAIVKPIHSLVVSPDPQCPFTILVEGVDQVAGKPVFRRVTGESAVLVPAQAAIPRANPDSARAVLVNTVDIVTTETVVRGISGDRHAPGPVQRVTCSAQPDNHLPVHRHGAAALAVKPGSRTVGRELAVFQAAQAAIGDGPQAAAVVFAGCPRFLQ